MTEREFTDHVAAFKNARLTGPLVDFDDVPENWLSVIIAQALRAAHGRGAESDRLYVGVLHSYGIMCPHPRDRQADDPDGWDYFRCSMCECIVVYGYGD